VPGGTYQVSIVMWTWSPTGRAGMRNLRGRTQKEERDCACPSSQFPGEEPVNRPTVQRLLVAAASILASAVFAASAQATLAISSFSVTPSTLQAGGSTTTAGPNLNVSASFTTTNGDSPDDLLLSLAPGLLANPSIVPFCSVANFDADSCASSSEIGSGTVTGTAPEFGTTLNLPATAYLVQPAGSEIADIGLIVTFFDYPVATQIGPVNIRNTPTVGVNIPLNGLPDTIEGVPVQLNGLNLTLAGSANGQPFTRNPTSCTSATSNVTVTSYLATTTDETASSSFTPTGCSSLPYAPTITGTISKDSSDPGIAMTASIGSSYNQADSQAITIDFPYSASPNIGALLADECTPATSGNPWAACTSVGTASITTPLLSKPLSANIYLEEHTGALPSLEIVIPAPFNITLVGTPVLTGSTFEATVNNIPDIPITTLALNIPGGANSLFLAGVHLCTQAQSFAGAFSSWSGASASPSSSVTVSGCPSSSTAVKSAANPLVTAAASTPATRWVSNSEKANAAASAKLATSTTGQIAATGLSTGKAKLVVAIGGGKRTSGIRSVSFRLPAGFSLDSNELSRGVAVAVDGKSVASTSSLRHGLLTVTFAKPGKVAFITIGAPALKVSKALRSGHSRTLSLTATLTRTSGSSATLHLSSDAR
jgi:hypothetical protein